jgi:hypothetical protein
MYRLADYLDQHGRHHRKDQFPPPGFWAAAADHAHTRDQIAFGDAARARGLLRVAAQLHRCASARGDSSAAARLVGIMHEIQPADQRPARWAADHAALDNPRSLASLIERFRDLGADQQITTLLDRDPASHVALSDPDAVARLLNALRRVGADQQITTLLDRDPAADRRWFTTGDVPGFIPPDEAMRGPGPGEPVIGRYGSSTGDGMARKFAAAFNDPDEAVRQQAAIEADSAIAHIHLDGPFAVATMLDVLRAAGADRQVAALLSRDPAAHVALDDIWKLTHLLQALRDVGADQQIAALLSRDPAAHVALDEENVPYLLNALREVGADEQFTALANRLPAAGLFDIF